MNVVTWNTRSGGTIDLCDDCTDLPSECFADYREHPVSVHMGRHWSDGLCGHCCADYEYRGVTWTCIGTTIKDVWERFPLSEGYDPISDDKFELQNRSNDTGQIVSRSIHRRYHSDVETTVSVLRVYDRSDMTTRYFARAVCHYAI